MKKLLVLIGLLLITVLCSGQLNYRLDYSKPMIEKRSVVIVVRETRPLELHLKKDNGPKVTATVVYLCLNGIVSLNQFTSPPNVQKDLLPAYIGTIVLTSVGYGLFLIIN